MQMVCLKNAHYCIVFVAEAARVTLSLGYRRV